MNSAKQKSRIIVLSLIGFFIFFANSLKSQDLDPNNWPSLVGYWQFQDTSDLTKATVGNDLILVGQHKAIEGAAYGDTAIQIDTGSYYKYYHGIQSNGGGDSVNQYTLMFDFKVLSLNTWHSFFQTDTTNNNDGECFIKHWGDSIAGSIGVGYTGYSSDSIIPNEWYRLVISVNLGVSYDYYLNGSLLHIGDTDDIAVDDRFALTEAILFFADNNQEDDTINVASIAIFDTCLTATQIAILGTIEPCIANPPIVNIDIDSLSIHQGGMYHDTMYVHMNYLIDTIRLDAGTGFKTYLWSTGDTTQYIDFPRNAYNQDTVSVEVTDMNDCIANGSLIVIWDFESIEEHEKLNFFVYPNPASQFINIKFAKPLSKEEELRIYNSIGQKVKEINIHRNQTLLKIDISNLNKGVYYYELGNASGKIIIM